MSNIEKLTARINACKHPRRVYNALFALAPLIRATREVQQREKEGDTWHEQHADDP